MENIAELTQQEEGVSSRRKAMMLGGAALAGLALSRGARAQSTTTITDSDILNFALNLEYLEAQFYTLATTGKTIDQVGGVISGVGGAGGTVSVKASPMVPFQNATLQAYAMETAAEERNHVKFLQGALTTAAVAMPNIDLMASFNALAAAAGIGPTFDPFASEANFLIGAYIFEDVGVTAYLGAAPLLTVAGNLTAALEIHAVEAYHAGAVRTQIFAAGAPLTTYSQQISVARQALADMATAGSPVDTGVSVVANTPLNMQASTIVDVNPATAIVLGRTTSEVLRIVYGGGAPGTGGAFFPNGTNGLIK